MNGVVVLVPVMIMGIAVAGIISSTILKLQRLRSEEARHRAGAGDTGELAERVAVLEQDLAEVQERLDFTERLLAQAREHRELPPGAPPA